MRQRQFLLIVLTAACLALMLPLAAAAQGRGQGFRPCPYAPYLCKPSQACKPFNETGKVAKVLTETLEEGMYPGMAFLLDTKSQGQVLVHLGPVWYLERQEFDLQPGELVSIQGVCDQKSGKLEVIAYELVKGDYVLHLRDSQGRPNWEAWRKR
jgi:hypothetical protein